MAESTTLPPERRQPRDNRGKPSTRVAKAERRRQVTTMLLAGATEEEIAQALEMTPYGVSKIINRLLDTWESRDREQVEHVRTIQLRRLDDLTRRLTMDLRKRDGSTNLAVVDRLHKLEALRARIAGTEAAQKVEHSGSIGHHIERDEIERLEDAWARTGSIEGTAVELPAGDG